MILLALKKWAPKSREASIKGMILRTIAASPIPLRKLVVKLSVRAYAIAKAGPSPSTCGVGSISGVGDHIPDILCRQRSR